MFAVPLLAAVVATAAVPKPVAGFNLAAVPPENRILQTLRKEHPRLIGLPADLERLKQAIKDDRPAADAFKTVVREADKILPAKPVEHKLIGPRLLDQSRRCLDRVYTLCTVYRVTGDRRYADRAIKEMMTAAEFPDWNPSHFLDTAEMTHALAIGYDWLFDILPAADRAKLRTAIIEKGLRPAEKVYRSGKGWPTYRHNWNQVCNGGIALGALAIAEDEPAFAAWLVRRSVETIPLAMQEYGPDGGWGEGPGYWGYATHYNVYYLAGLESALGTDFGLSRIPGFALAGDFRLHSTGPTKLSFNFADAGDKVGSNSVMYWLARKFNRPDYAWFERDFMGRATPLGLWWYDNRPAQPAEFVKDRWFHHVDVVFLRSDWERPEAVYVGLKGGDNKVNHSHLELGTFVLDALGQRWAFDPGPDDYNLPGYFGKQRWTYYRLSTAGQNTLLIDGKNQDSKAVAPVVAFTSTAERAHAVIDLTAAYAGQVRQAARGMALLNRKQVLVQDDVQGCTGQELVWQMHTKAEVTADGSQAVLKLGGQQLTARLLSPPKAVFSVEEVSIPAPQRSLEGARRLTIKLSRPERSLRVAVLFTPGASAADTVPALTPLAQWSGRGK